MTESRGHREDRSSSGPARAAPVSWIAARHSTIRPSPAYAARMLSLLSVWLGLAALILSAAMAIHRSWFNDVGLSVALYTGILSLTLSGMTLWSLRNVPRAEPGAAARRRQSKAGIGLSVTAIAIVYTLVGRLAAGR